MVRQRACGDRLWRNRIWIGIWACLFIIGAPLASRGIEPADEARRLLERSGVQGGIVVHVHCGDGRLATALAQSPGFLVQGLHRDAAAARSARDQLRNLESYGRLSFRHWAGRELPFVENMVNLLIVDRDSSGQLLEDAEILRVLTPHGIALVRGDDDWQTIVKPRLDSIDEWTHYLHDPTGNAVAHDDVVGPPRHLQWLGSPRWSRHHDRMASMSAMVSSGGRVFYIMDEGSRVSIQLPPKWHVVARDAFNGTVLWKQPIARWHNHLWPLKSGPTQLARRLVATNDSVYATLSIDGPLVQMDAATGQVVQTFANTSATEEILVDGNTLILLVNRGARETDDFAPQENLGDQKRVAGEYFWNEQPREIMVLDSRNGDLRWSITSRVAPITLAADSERVYYHDGEKVVSRHRADGQVAWTSAAVPRRQDVQMNFAPRLVVYQDIVLYAGGERTMTAFAAKSGDELWSAEHDKSGYQSPEDLLVAGGLVWSAPTTRTADTGLYTGRDPYTGEVKIQFPPDVETYWFHHRCYLAKATDKFLLPSRTGIEFVDFEKQHWDIHHWVRGGCLYGVMPCNGLLYAPPHNCACYPEAKLYGMNALAPATISRSSDVWTDDRLQTGPAFATPLIGAGHPALEEWPTYRGNVSRSGATTMPLGSQLQTRWKTPLAGPLSAVVVAGGRLLVAQVDRHTVHSLDADDGQLVWSFTAQGRVDSPPTVYRGRVLFGSADGWVYCLKADDGQLVWRFRAAPREQQLTAFEQLESVWPVHGNVLVQNNVATCVAGRSSFLDGGMRLIRLDVESGNLLSETVLDEKDPETGENLQSRIQVLNMPVGLPDILSTDGKHMYMRSQVFDMQGQRQELGPHSGVPAAQASVQRGDTVHLFAPMGFLDDTWFHRAYWVYGRSYAGGHAGYSQAGKYTPAGRILVKQGDRVYGFGRLPKYYRWTTILEHQLFASDAEPPQIPEAAQRRGGTIVRVDRTDSLDPTGKPLVIEAWVRTQRRQGVVVARGGPSQGYALIVEDGKPKFVTRVEGQLAEVAADRDIMGRWVHLAGVLTEKQVQIFVDGRLAATADSKGLIPSDPAQAMEIGGDDRGSVGSYNTPNALTGLVDEVRIYHGTLTADEIAAHHADPTSRKATDAVLVAAYSFDDGKAGDHSEFGNHGTVSGAEPAPGKVGQAMRFVAVRGGGGAAGGNDFHVDHHWTQGVPLLVRSMVAAGDTLFIAGPPDLIDEEDTFRRLVQRDASVLLDLAAQDAALSGDQPARLLAVSATTGETIASYDVDAPPVWDGMAAAGGRLYLATQDGQIICWDAQ